MSTATTQFVIIKKSSLTGNYIVPQAMNYDFYLLYLLVTQANGESQTSAKNWVNFCKRSSLKCITTSQLFINKNNGYIELFSIYDLASTDDLCLPKSPQFIMTAKNFMNFMVQKSHIYQQQPNQFFIAIDSQGHAHLTTNLQTITKVSFLKSLHNKIMSFFSKTAR